MEGPRILHICTKKGKGFEPAEKDPAVWHAPGKFNPVTGERAKPAPGPHPPKYQDVFGETLTELAEKNDRIIGITAAMPSGTSMSIMQNSMPDRVFDVGISEGHAVTFAGGLAKEGWLPFCAIYSSFLQRGYDHIIHDVAIQHLPVTFCIDRAGLVGEDGVTHHGCYDLAYLRTIPGMTIASPSNEMMLRNLMFTAQKRADGPFAIRYPRGSGKNTDWKQPMCELQIGKGSKLSDGTDVAVLTIGPVAYDAAKAVEMAREKGVSAAHFDMIFLKPIDEDLLREVAEKNCPIVTVEDASINGGLGSAVIEWLNDNGFARKVVRLGIPDKFIAQGTPAELRKLCGFDADSIAETIINLANK